MKTKEQEMTEEEATPKEIAGLITSAIILVFLVWILANCITEIRHNNYSDSTKLYVSYPEHCGVKYRFVVEIANNPESNLYVLEDGTWFETKPINLNGGMKCIDVYYQYNSSVGKEGVKS